jgi:hypothetical protein
MASIDRIAKFIAQSVRNMTDHGSCVKIELRQIVDGGANRPMNEWAIKDVSEASSDDAVEELAAEIYAYAQEDANAYSTPNRYVLCAWFGSQKQADARSPAFVMRGEGDAEAGPTETADAKGLAAQAMRHVEVIMRQATSSYAQVLDAQDKTIARLSNALEKREDREISVMELANDLITHKQDGEIRLMEARQKAKQKEAIGSAIKMIGPVLVNKFAGKDIFPSDDSPLMVSLEGVFEEIPDDVFMEFASKLSEPARIALTELYQALARRKGERIQGEEP